MRRRFSFTLSCVLAACASAQEGMLPDGIWTQLAAPERGERPGFDGVYDNVEQVRFFQNPSGQRQCNFRAKVRRNGTSALEFQAFTLASRRAFVASLPP